MSRRPILTCLMLLLVAALAQGCSASTLDFTIGECVNVPDGQQINDYETVDCSESHDSEVFALPQRPDGPDTSYPGQPDLEDFAAERCRDEFEPYVGASFDISVLNFTVLVPSQDSWEQAEDREIVCLLTGEQVDGTFAQLQGPKRDSGE